jgi:nucleoside-diphosphate-sugar epimerase
MPDRHALVFGASGITGWAAVNALLNDYPTPDTFKRVTALTNRPLSAEDALWPALKKLNIVSGLDLLAGDQATLEETIRERVPSIETVSHVYFFAYIFNSDPQEEIRVNVELLKRAVTAVDKLSAKLEFVLLPTGVKVRPKIIIHPLDTHIDIFHSGLRRAPPRQIPLRLQPPAI